VRFINDPAEAERLDREFREKHQKKQVNQKKNPNINFQTKQNIFFSTFGKEYILVLNFRMTMMMTAPLRHSPLTSQKRKGKKIPLTSQKRKGKKM
jgi:hypothetical protein